MPVAMTVTVKDLGPALTRIASGIVNRDFKQALKACAVILGATMKKDMAAGRSPDGTTYKPLAFARPNGKSSPLWDTGAMARSVAAGANHVEKIGALSLEMGTNAEQASLMHFGGDVKPKKGKYLAIPLTMAAKRAGSPRNFPGGLTPRFGKKGGVLLGKGKGKRAKVEAQYALSKGVKITPRPFVGISAAALAQCEAVLAKAMGA